MRHRTLQHFVLVGALATAVACGRADAPASDRETPAQPGTAPADAPRTPGSTAEPGARGTAGTGSGEAARDAGSPVGAAAETADVKLALSTAEGVDATGINVDTNHETKTVTLKGTVPTTDQRARAEVVAQREATGYRINNQLVVRAR
jgi:hypothetical protein